MFAQYISKMKESDGGKQIMRGREVEKGARGRMGIRKVSKKQESQKRTYNVSSSLLWLLLSGLYTNNTPLASFWMAGQQFSNLKDKNMENYLIDVINELFLEIVQGEIVDLSMYCTGRQLTYVSILFIDWATKAISMSFL